MIKACKVLLNNSAVTVVLFGDKEVQLPPIGRKAQTVFVSFENGRYKIADDGKVDESNIQEEEKKPEPPKARRRTIKKPVEEVEE